MARYSLNRPSVNVLETDAVKIDFKPLYQCIHIYDTLDARDELQASYQADRRVSFSSRQISPVLY
jgi:hypothetical protein